MIARAEFIRAVRSCIGTEVIHMGRKPGKALDCVGLPWAACNSLGMGLPATMVNNAMPSEADLTAGMSKYCAQVDDGGHLLQVYIGREARHIVVPVGFNECGQVLVVHAWGYGRKVCEAVFDKPVLHRWNIRGIE